MNTAHNLFLLMFNISQLHNKKTVIKLFTEGLNDIFSNCNCTYSKDSDPNSDLELPIETRSSFFGFLQINNPKVITQEHRILINNAALMLAVILERLDFDQKLKRENERFKQIADRRLLELKDTIQDLKETKKASINLIEDLTDEIEKRTLSEKKLKESEERFRNLFENMSSCVAVYQAVDHGENFRIIDFNTAAQKAEKISEKDVIGKLVTEVFPGVTEFGLLDSLKRVWATGKPENHPVTEYKDERISGWRKNYIYKLPSGEMITLYDDVTEQRKAQLDLIESETRFRTLFETMAQGVVYQNNRGEITMANKAAERILGLSFKQMIGKKSVDPDWKAVDKDKNSLPGQKHPAMIALRTGKEIKDFIQGIYNPAIKSYVWIIVNSRPQFRKGAPKPYQVFSTFLDITERKKAEDELRELKENLEKEIQAKTRELTERVEELERFQEATIEREFRIKELRDELEQLKSQKQNNSNGSS
ncbi:MAG: PAS domain S-box protein [Bacteroidales bacterium]|jgi:PAS domain S-box-containing protein|nr:PAS domain S-box protein [Bacteroidales bacterium]